MSTPDATTASPDDLPDLTPTLPNGRTRLSVPQAAKHLGMGKRTLWGLIHAEKVQHRRIGGQVFLLWPDDINLILDDAIREAKPAA